VLSLVLALAGAVAATGDGARGAGKLVLTFRITQGPTFRHPHPPVGDAGDGFSTTLTLYNAAEQLDRPKNARMGTMRFAYTLKGSCTAAGGCRGTVDIQTLTRLPGGTIAADANGIPIRYPFVVIVRKGTGRYAGAKGSISIAPAGNARNVYTLELP